jgi:hypothetical protein
VISGFDRSVGGQDRMRWRLLGLVPVMAADGEFFRYRPTSMELLPQPAP